MKHFFRFSFAAPLLLAAHQVAAATSLTNPLGSTDNPDQVIANVIQVFLGLVGGIALLIFVYGGFMMLISRGNPEKVKSGQDALVWATLGLIIIFGSYGIVRLIFQAIG
jgi:type IV secretory pathway VirB2 component (pilin)